jgi:isopentenyldiphosphate isomerase
VADDELLDVVDDLGRPLGVADRRTVHAEGLWHRVTHILLVADREGVPTVVLQQRAHHKATFPGLFDLSATGHLAAGESPIDGRRELREELGIDLRPAAMVPLGVRRIVDEIPGGVNRELAHVFLAADDRPLVDYAPDRAEVAAVVDLPVSRGLDLVTGVVTEVPCVSVEAGSSIPTVRSLTAADLVPEPPVDGGEAVAPTFAYWTVVLVMAARFAAGDRGLAI